MSTPVEPSLFSMAFPSADTYLIAVFLSVYVVLGVVTYVLGRSVASVQVPRTERVAPSYVRGCFPKTQQKLTPRFQQAFQIPLFTSLAISILCLILLGLILVNVYFPGAASPTDGQDFTFGLPELFRVALSVLSIVTLVFFFFSGYVHSLRAILSTIICPHCLHGIPVSNKWVCPYKNCEATNPTPVVGILVDDLASTMGRECGVCGQVPAGIKCTSCGEPIYFTDIALRQKPSLCAYAVGDIPFEEVGSVTTEQAVEPPLDDESLTARVQAMFRMQEDLVNAQKKKAELLAKLKESMPLDEYVRFEETVNDKFERESRKWMTGR